MRLVLHVGAGKTGTSTLQSTLRTHGRTLARAGVLYPVSSRHALNHSPLVGVFKPDANMPRGVRPRGSANLASVRRTGEECWREIVGQVRASDAETCVLSSEYFFSRLGLEDLAERLRTEFDEIRVVAYVRPPAARYLSTMQQQVKASSRITAPKDFRSTVRGNLTRHLRVFEGNVTVRPFDRSMLVGGCIVQDFLATALPTADGLAREIRVEDRNESLSAEAVCIMQELRRYGWPDQEGRFTPEGAQVMRVLREMERRSPQTPPRLRRGIAAKLTESHVADLEWLRERFGIEFEAPEEPWTDQRDPEGWSSDRFLDILEVDRERVDRILFELVKELAAHTEPRGSIVERLARVARRAHLRLSEVLARDERR